MNEDNLSILFITRKYPPSVGGMERLSYRLTTETAKQVNTHIISWGHGQWGLPLFLIWAFCRALIYLIRGQVKLIHLGDAVLCPLGCLLRWLGHVPVTVSTHGLDVTFPSPIYQLIVRLCIRYMDRLICNSYYTRTECIQRGASADRCVVISPGVDCPTRMRFSTLERQALASRWGIDLRERHILLTIGRLVPRKGIAQFVAEALPLLLAKRDDWFYLVVGEGPERSRIEQAIEHHKLQDYVKLLGMVSEADLWNIYGIADLFVMPNVSVLYNPEGFGIVVLEARAAGIPVVAANIEGIREAAGDAGDCTLVEPGNWPAFCMAIEMWLDRDEKFEVRERRRAQTITQHAWSRVADQYLTIFREVLAESNLNQGK